MLRLVRSAVALAVLSPAVVVAPAVLAEVGSDPRPVAPHVQEIALPEAAPTLTKQAVRGEASPQVQTAELDTQAFSLVGVTWEASPRHGEVAVDLRTRTDGRWSGWTSVDDDSSRQDAATADDPASRAGTEPVWAGDADGVQVRLTVVSGEAPTGVQVALIDPGTSPADASVTADPPASADAATPRPEIHSRAEWGADERLRRRGPSYASTLRATTLHHTASGNSYSPEDVPALLRGFYAYHTRSRGWSDIGYNALVDKFGRVWEGRSGGVDRPVVGTHAGGFNTGTFGISMIGNYEGTEPPAPMLDAVARTMAWKLSMHGVDPRGSVVRTSGGGTRFPAGQQVTLPTIFGHRDVSRTACPGDRAYRQMPALRERVASLMAGGDGGAFSTSAPIGALDGVTASGTRGAQDVSVRGWALDRDTRDPVTVRFSLGGAPATEVRADQPRPDVDAAFGYGEAHGFSGTLPAVPPGRHEVCVDAVDPLTGDVTRVGCATVTVPSGPDASPPAPPAGPPSTVKGALDGVAVVPGGLLQQGWAYDADDPAAVTKVDLILDGRLRATAKASQPRSDVTRADKAAPEATGWSARLDAGPGEHTVCAIAYRVPRADAGSPVGCRTVRILDGPRPLGSLDAVDVEPGQGVRVRGWAVDPASSDTAAVQVVVDGQPASTVDASWARSDVGRVFPGYGDFHGFSASVPLGPGAHEVCVQALDRETGRQIAPLGCATRTVTGNPTGVLDVLERSGDTVRLMGWAIDPDLKGPTAIRVRVARTPSTFAADGERGDLAVLGHGTRHGFDETVQVGPGPAAVCVWAMNGGEGTAHRPLGCRSL